MSMYSRILILFALFVSIQVTAQYDRRARPNKLLEKELSDIRRASELNPIGALEQLDMYVKRNTKLIDESIQLQIYALAGKINYQLGQFELSISNYRKALEKKSAPSKFLSSSKTGTYLSNSTWFEYAQALYANQSYQEARRVVIKYLSLNTEGDIPSYVRGLLLGANIAIDSDSVEASLVYLKTAQSLTNELEDPELELEIEYTLGRATEKSIQFDASLFNYQNALRLSDSLSLDEKSEEITESIGRVYRSQDDPQGELSFKISRRAKSIEDENRISQNTLNLDIASIYLELDQAEDAIPYLQESVTISEEDGNLETNIAARKSLSDVYAAAGDYNLALANYRSYVDLVDQLYSNKELEIALSAQVQKDLFERQQTINSLEKDRQLYENEIAILEQERAFQEESLSFQRTSIYGLTVLVLIVLGASVLLYRSNQHKRVANQLLALKSLRSQMNPHFIFNALNSVNSFISSNEVRDANKYLTDFSRLMRIVMENSQKEFIPFDEEMEVLELYLKLEHFRFQDQFDYELSIGDELDLQELKVPPMLAQPYIENAIWHGLRYKEGQGKLCVKIKKGEQELRMLIRDDGIGRKKSETLKTSNQKTYRSTGMRNTQDRIDLINKTYHSHIIVNVHDLDPGTEVDIRIPLKLLA